jgi:hypothetical protein
MPRLSHSSRFEQQGTSILQISNVDDNEHGRKRASFSCYRHLHSFGHTEAWKLWLKPIYGWDVWRFEYKHVQTVCQGIERLPFQI